MLSKTGFTHSDLLCWQIDYAGGSLNVNGTIMRDTYSQHHVIQWTGNSNFVLHQVVEFSSGKNEDIKSRHDRAMIDLCSYDTVFKIPVWWGGDGNYYKADGSVAYTV
ncbi:hypothetical protein CTZ93_002670 [Salmonella enterica subsp. enterica serovar Hvittingfoss]|nr:hypothetical protein [Salmonella enterica subsp. enterica serovar Hvittingfoss]